MVFIRQVKINGAYVIVIDSVLNVLKIVVGHWHSKLKKLLIDSLLRILELVSKLIVLGIKLLSERHLGHFIVDLCKLLHLKVMLSNQVLLLLGKVSKVSSWGASVDLT
jgi:hypothetical protein